MATLAPVAKRTAFPGNRFAQVFAWLVLSTCSAAAFAADGPDDSSAARRRPNVVWMMLEDWGPDMSCYVAKGVSTPTCDKLASQGIRYLNAFSTSPVCSTSRSAMMTGFHQNYIGAHQHRTKDKRPLPHGIKTLPTLLKEAGYFTCLMRSRKTDCNFSSDLGIARGDWKKRAPGQPFFAQITFQGTHRRWKRDRIRPIDAKHIELPPYYPDTPLVRRD